MVKLIVVLLASSQLLTYAGSASCQPPAKSSLSGIQVLRQPGVQWCWAAVGVMTLGYFQIPAKMCDLASQATPKQCESSNPAVKLDCCNNSGDPACDFPCWPPLQKADGFGLDSNQTKAGLALSYAELKTQIHCKRAPVAVSWWSEDRGHIALAIGYKTVQGIPNVKILDPIYGNGPRLIPYSEYDVPAGFESHWRDYYDIRKVAP